jgi:hypothetical protein
MKIVDLADFPKEVGGIYPGPEELPNDGRNPSKVRHQLHRQVEATYHSQPLWHCLGPTACPITPQDGWNFLETEKITRLTTI